MRVRVLLVPCLLLIGGAWWLRRGNEAPVHGAAKTAAAAVDEAPAPTPQPTAPLPRVASPAAAAPTAEALGATRLDPRSNAFRQKLDEQIPAHLYAEAARCYKGGLKQDQQLDVSYRVHVNDGTITISDFEITDDSVNDAKLTSCIKQQILAATWKDDALPDVEEDDDLFISGDALKRYVSAEPAGSGAQVN